MSKRIAIICPLCQGVASMELRDETDLTSAYIFSHKQPEKRLTVFESKTTPVPRTPLKTFEVGYQANCGEFTVRNVRVVIP